MVPENITLMFRSRCQSLPVQNYRFCIFILYFSIKREQRKSIEIPNGEGKDVYETVKFERMVVRP
jgi:hypothetical protein